MMMGVRGKGGEKRGEISLSSLSLSLSASTISHLGERSEAEDAVLGLEADAVGDLLELREWGKKEKREYREREGRG